MAATPTNFVVPTTLLLLLYITPVSKSSAFKSCSDYQKASQPTLCLRLQEHSDKTDEYSILTAIGALKLNDKIFPVCNDFWEALIAFDEPLYPIPLGPSIYFCLCVAILFCYIMSKCVRSCFEKTRRKLILHPQTAKLPSLPLYWLQQSRREESLKREVRDTWAWLAKKFMLSPADPLLEGIEETLGNTTWADFQVPRDTWSLINTVLKANELYVGVHQEHGGDGRSKHAFQIMKGQRDADGVVQGPFSQLPRHVLPHDLRDGDEEEEVMMADGSWKLKKTTPGKDNADGTPTPAAPTESFLNDPIDRAQQPTMTKQDWKEEFKKRKQSRASIAAPPVSVLQHQQKKKHIRHHRKLRQGSTSSRSRLSHTHSIDPALEMDHAAYFDVARDRKSYKKAHPGEVGHPKSSLPRKMSPTLQPASYTKLTTGGTSTKTSHDEGKKPLPKPSFEPFAPKKTPPIPIPQKRKKHKPHKSKPRKPPAMRAPHKKKTPPPPQPPPPPPPPTPPPPPPNEFALVARPKGQAESTTPTYDAYVPMSAADRLLAEAGQPQRVTQSAPGSSSRVPGGTGRSRPYSEGDVPGSRPPKKDRHHHHHHKGDPHIESEHHRRRRSAHGHHIERLPSLIILPGFEEPQLQSNQVPQNEPQSGGSSRSRSRHRSRK